MRRPVPFCVTPGAGLVLQESDLPSGGHGAISHIVSSWYSRVVAAAGVCVQVRKDQKEIDLAVLKEAMDKVRLGLPHTSLPDTPAKRRWVGG